MVYMVYNCVYYCDTLCLLFDTHLLAVGSTAGYAEEAESGAGQADSSCEPYSPMHQIDT
jgi:hypothetical protein